MWKTIVSSDDNYVRTPEGTDTNIGKHKHVTCETRKCQLKQLSNQQNIQEKATGIYGRFNKVTKKTNKSLLLKCTALYGLHFVFFSPQKCLSFGSVPLIFHFIPQAKSSLHANDNLKKKWLPISNGSAGHVRLVPALGKQKGVVCQEFEACWG